MAISPENKNKKIALFSATGVTLLGGLLLSGAGPIEAKSNRFCLPKKENGNQLDIGDPTWVSGNIFSTNIRLERRAMPKLANVKKIDCEADQIEVDRLGETHTVGSHDLAWPFFGPKTP